jgi:hypothetical protein
MQTATSAAVNPPSRTSARLQASARTASTEQRGPGITRVKFLQGTDLNDGKGPLIPTRTRGQASDMSHRKRQRAQQQVEFNSCGMPASWTSSKWELAKPTTDSVRLCLEQVMPGAYKPQHVAAGWRVKHMTTARQFATRPMERNRHHRGSFPTSRADGGITRCQPKITSYSPQCTGRQHLQQPEGSCTGAGCHSLLPGFRCFGHSNSIGSTSSQDYGMHSRAR